MSSDDVRAAIDAAMQSGGVVPLGQTVLCDWCDADWTARPESGGFLFGSKATCPDCAPRLEAGAKAHGEESFIRARCPEGTSFAGWVRNMRGPDAAVRVTGSLSALLDGEGL